MFDIRIHAEPFALWMRRASELLQADAKQSLGQAAGLAVQTAKGTTLFKDGPNEHRKDPHLRDTIGRTAAGQWAWKIKATSTHALFVEEDTKAHEIRPKRTSMVSSRRSASRRMVPLLRFRIAGQWISKAFVKHPGTKGTHFLQRATELAGQKLEEMLERAVKRSFH